MIKDTPNTPLLQAAEIPHEIAAIKALADDAGSEIAMIGLPSPVHGLPKEVPAFINRRSGVVSGLNQLFESYRFAPERKVGTAKVKTLESFIELTNRHKTPASVIFAEIDWQKPSLTTVVDYHENLNGGTADNGKHRIHYEFPLSEEWKAWVKIHGKPLEQTEFAEFIEDHISELASPGTDEEEDFRKLFGFKVAYPNELVTLSRGLKIHTETRVKNSVTLQSGEGEITWEEEHRDGQGNKIVVPGLFILSVPLFFGGAVTRIPVRLRYRVAGGKVVWICQLYRPDKYITEEVTRDLERAAGDTGLPSYQGAPEMSV